METNIIWKKCVYLNPSFLLTTDKWSLLLFVILCSYFFKKKKVNELSMKICKRCYGFLFKILNYISSWRKPFNTDNWTLKLVIPTKSSTETTKVLLGKNEETLSHMSLINSPSTSPKLIAKEEKQGDKVKPVLVLYWYVYRENYNTHFIDKVKKNQALSFKFHCKALASFIIHLLLSVSERKHFSNSMCELRKD